MNGDPSDDVLPELGPLPPAAEEVLRQAQRQVLPESHKDEEAVGGGVLFAGRRALAEVRRHMEPEDIQHPAIQAIIEAAIALDQAGEPIDCITVASRMRQDGTFGRLRALHGEVYLSDLANAVATVENIGHHAAMVRQAAKGRRAARLGARIKAALEQGDHASAVRLGKELERVLRPLKAKKSASAKKPEDTDWQKHLARDGKGKLIKGVDNVIAILTHDERWRGILGWNELTGAPQTLAPPPWHSECEPDGGSVAGPWHDADTVRTLAWLGKAWQFRPSRQMVQDALLVVMRQRSFHPVREYLLGLVWDGQKRIDTWLSVYLGTKDTPYERMIGRWWLISGVARALAPGPDCIVRTVLVLEGHQELKKSTAARILGGAWFKDTRPRLESKDAYIAMRGAWVYEFQELDGLTKQEDSHVKALVSSPSDNYRDVFGRHDEIHHRSCIFVGTVNPGWNGYLKDPTGGSRWWPCKCTKIETDALRRDRDQLWAEAREAFLAKEKWWAETVEEKELCRLEQDARFQSDAREELIARWLDDPGPTAMGKILAGELTTEMILAGALKLDPLHMDRVMQTIVGIAMVRLGWVRKRRPDGLRQRVYLRPDILQHAELLKNEE
jgi:predicted P-loop ATPase